jgi:biopolymer transport protein ExbD
MSTMIVRAIAVGFLLAASCMVTPVMHFGEGKSRKQAQHDTMAEFGPARLVTGEKWAGEVTTRKIRVWADGQYRTQNIHWQQTFDEAIELANVVIEPLFGLRLTAEYRVWDRNAPGTTLTDDMAALEEQDSGSDVFAVIGLTSSLPLVSATFEQLGLAMLNGRHIMLRGYADLEERKMYANAFPDLRPEERELALEHLRHHKTAVVLLHELGHILGVEHEQDSTTIMNDSYSNHETSFSPYARQIMLATVDQRLARTSSTPTLASAPTPPSPPAALPTTQRPPATAPPPTTAPPAVHHDPVVIRVTKKRETIVSGKRLTPEALDALLKAAFADDPKTPIVINQDRSLPTGVVGDLLDQLKAIGFAKVEFAWSGH